MTLPDFTDYDSVFNRCLTVEIAPAADIISKPIERAAPLWAPFWYEGEISVLFSETNVGKSIVSVQIAHDISRGHCSVTDTAMEAQKVLYFDYELSERQFKSRYGGACFGAGFYRAAPRQEHLGELDIDKAFNDIIKAMRSGYKAIIVDNITFLSDAIKDASHSLRMMKTLKANTARYGCSLLLIAHTPKRAQNRIITKADISGSSNILNFADSAFALGRSYLDPAFRYLKQIKVRENTFEYTEDAVLVGIFDKTDGFLQFKPVAVQSEYLHIEK